MNGSKVDEVFNFVKKELPGFLGTTSVKWNFTKFLIDKDGYGFRRYSPSVYPETCCVDIETLLTGLVTTIEMLPELERNK